MGSRRAQAPVGQTGTERTPISRAPERPGPVCSASGMGASTPSPPPPPWPLAKETKSRRPTRGALAAGAGGLPENEGLALGRGVGGAGAEPGRKGGASSVTRRRGSRNPAAGCGGPDESAWGPTGRQARPRACRGRRSTRAAPPERLATAVLTRSEEGRDVGQVLGRLLGPLAGAAPAARTRCAGRSRGAGGRGGGGSAAAAAAHGYGGARGRARLGPRVPSAVRRPLRAGLGGAERPAA
jgi:hypothetical protein